MIISNWNIKEDKNNMKKYKLTCDFFDTEDAAIKFCNKWNDNQSKYMNKYHPAHYTPWESKDHTEHKFVVFYRW